MTIREQWILKRREKLNMTLLLNSSRGTYGKRYS